MNLQRKVGIITLIPFTLTVGLFPLYFHLGKEDIIVNTMISVCIALTIGFGFWLLKLDSESSKKAQEESWDGEHP